MKAVPKFSGVVKDGRVVLHNPTMYNAWLEGLEGKNVYIVVRKEKKPRSDEQNRYYWGVIVSIIARHLGYTPDEAHEALKHTFLCETEDAYGQLMLPRITSTTKLSTADFEYYMELIRMWAQEYLNITIPLPTQVDF